MAEIHTEVVVIGSGAGGATIAKELSARGKEVLVVEKGPFVNQACFYDRYGLREKSKEGVHISRAIMAGGTTVVSCGNGVRSLEKELHTAGINLNDEFEEAEKELDIAPIPDKFIGEDTKRIMEAARELGFEMEPMPKFINPEKCICCGKCIHGCQKEAKWTALKYLSQAKDNGASLLTNAAVTEVLISNGEAIGVRGTSPKGEIIVSAEIVVLAAGGIGTPIILQRSGIPKAGNRLFCDLFNVTYGTVKNAKLTRESSMAVVNHEFSSTRGFILSPYVDMPLTFSSMLKMAYILRTPHPKKVFGIMTKIKDDCLGRVNEDGSIEKSVTLSDYTKLNEGAFKAKEILIKAGVNPKSIVTTKPGGAHPGGTAAIGDVINEDQETEISRLFVSDASVLPTSPGLPPILTIIALSKRLAKKVVSI